MRHFFATFTVPLVEYGKKGFPTLGSRRPQEASRKKFPDGSVKWEQCHWAI